MTVRTVETIDTHTLGEPTRIVLDGFPELRGRTMKDRSRDLLRRHGAMRRALMWEPRGHHVMFGAVVVPPAAPGADVGLVFMDGGGAVEMCVHGTMGAVTALVETGRLNAPPDGVVMVDTPASVVRVRVRHGGGRVSHVELEGVPSCSVARNLRARVSGKSVSYDLAYGGLVVFRDHSVDRSPCGSCVSAFMAQLHAQRELDAGVWIKCENLLGLAFRARLVERAGELIPQLSGSAFITGEHRFRIDSRDPLRHGFKLS